MKSLFLKLFASASLKTGIAYALSVASLVANALSGILDAGGIPDDRRKQLAAILSGVIAVRDFLSKLAIIIGAPSGVDVKSIDDLLDKADQLDRITDKL